MTKRLGDDDRSAVDVILDQQADDGNPSGAFVGQANLAQRVDRVQRLLHLLEQMPSLEPPADLVTKTLVRIEQEAYVQPGRMHHVPQALTSERHQA
jgi:hypothetical protein